MENFSPTIAPTIGFALLLLVFSISIFLPFLNFVSTNKLASPQRLLKNSELEKISTILISLIFLCALFSQICLIFSFITSDYSVANVYQNSHHLKPLIYKISGSWGNHEGSMLLLITILSGYSLAFAFLSKIDVTRKVIILSSQSFIIAAFSAFTAFTSSPFLKIFPTPKSGLGLNPVLQDIGLAMHPPMLYTGYIGFSLVFSFAIAGLLTEKIDKNFAKYLKNWIFFSWGFLTLGIGLGSWWAYRELGWGGYWFWDPVENISLMPWLTATTLIHCIKLVEKKEIFKIWTAFLSILSFILCLLGIFLTRSGILTSVHSFAIDATRGFFVIALILIIGGMGLLIFGKKSGKIQSKTVSFSFWSKNGAILANNYFLVVALFIVLLGTIYPIFSQSIFNQFISIGPSYYNKLFGFLIIPFLAFLAISYSLNYSEKTPKDKIVNRTNSLICLICAFTTSLVFFYEKSTSFLQIAILFFAILCTVLTILSFLRTSFFKRRGSLLKKLFSLRSISAIPVTLAHLGFSLIITGIILTSSFGVTKEMNIKLGQSVKIENYEITFNDVNYTKGSNFVTRSGAFEVKKNDILYETLYPELRFYPIADKTTNEASIKSGFFGDIYIVLGQKDENDLYAIRIYTKPFIYLMWLGCAMIFAGAMVRILNNSPKKLKKLFSQKDNLIPNYPKKT